MEEEIIKEGQSNFGVPILDDNPKYNTLNCAVGIYNYQYYFGFNLPHYNKKHRKIMDGTYFLFDSTSKKLFSKADLESNGATFDNDLFGKPRIEKSFIKSYIDDMVFDINKDELFQKIKEQYKKYIDFIEPEEYDLMTIWDIGTYFCQLFNSYPYIHLHGLRNTAKSKVMQLSSNISFNSQLAMAMTMATLFRIVHINKPTLYIDEYEIVPFQQKIKEEKEFETILNSGYKKGGIVPRMEQEDKKWIAKSFEVYCPKMIANISGLQGALVSRCIKITMHRARPNDTRGDLFPNATLPEFYYIRNELYVFALYNWKEIINVYNNLEKEVDISTRDWELWKPLFAVARYISLEAYGSLKKLAVLKVKRSQEEEQMDDSWDFKLVEVLNDIVLEDKFYSLKDDIKPFLDRRFDDNQAKPKSEWIGRTLRKLGISEVKRTSDGMYYRLNPLKVKDLVARLQVIKMQNPNELIVTEESLKDFA